MKQVCHKINKILVLVNFFLLPLWLHAGPDWQKITQELFIQPEKYNCQAIPGGASNTNFHLTLDGSPYFVRIAPPATALLGADIEIEFQVLQGLSALNLSPQPIYFNKDKRILVTEFIQHDQQEIDLLDPSIRRMVIALLKEIENSGICILREYQPYHEILKFVEIIHGFEERLPEDFYTEALPALKLIDEILCPIKNKKLCHFDLHHKNILKKEDRLWLIDWEYATMCDPLLTLGSMASIERWDDQQMQNLLQDYQASSPPQDFYRLYLYRIITDIHWVTWNRIQSHLSPIDLPYKAWENLFLQAALERLSSPLFAKALHSLQEYKISSSQN